MPLPYELDTVMNGKVMLTSWTTAHMVGVSGNTLASMNPLGGVDPETLACGPILVTHDRCQSGKRIWALTSLGLAVRALISED